MIEGLRNGDIENHPLGFFGPSADKIAADTLSRYGHTLPKNAHDLEDMLRGAALSAMEFVATVDASLLAEFDTGLPRPELFDWASSEPPRVASFLAGQVRRDLQRGVLDE